MKPRFSILIQICLGLVPVSIILVAWFYFTPDIIPKRKFPSPHDVWSVLSLFTSSELIGHILITYGRVLLGWAVGCFLGNQVGLILPRRRLVRGLVTPVIEALRPIPPIALIPFFIAWFGPSDVGQIILIALSCFMVMAITTLGATKNLPQRYLPAALLLGASESRVFRTVVKPAIIPEQLSALRVASALAFAVGIAAELIGAQSGLGYLITVGRQSSATDTILFCIFLITIGSIFSVNQSKQ